jgi:hypothetical protein
VVEPSLLAALIPLGLAVLAIPVTRWFGRTVQGAVLSITGSATAALYVYHALVLPGTALHELTHLLCAWILRVPTGRVTLTPVVQSPGAAQFGSVQIAQVDPFRESLVGLAPLVSGVFAVIAIALGPLSLPALNTLLENPASAVMAALQARDSGLWVYLLAAIGNTMLPSAADRRAWLALLLVIVAATALLLLLGGGSIPEPALGWILRGAQFCGVAMALTLLVDVLLGALVRVLMLPFQRSA